MRMRILAMALLGLAAVTAAGCGKDPVQPAAKARLRMAHFAPTAPNADLWAGSSALGANLNFEKATGYTTVDATDFRVKALEAGKTDVLADNLLYIALAASRDYTCILTESPVGHYALALTIDDHSAISSSQAKLRFFHLSPDVADTLQLVLNGLATGGLARNDTNRQYYPVTPGTYAMKFRLYRDTTRVLAEREVELEGGKRYTLIFSGVNTGGPGYRMTVLNDTL
ncbi:MAG: DUF4397 domain-containing protein [Candidatus Eisenbacteria bacterium]|nr:DUF4397 domain-containing protein [Candidatus Eisenbacteria bacterium]